MNIMKNMKIKMILAYKYLESASDYRTAYRTMMPLLLNCLATFRTAIGMSTWHEDPCCFTRLKTYNIFINFPSCLSICFIG